MWPLTRDCNTVTWPTGHSNAKQIYMFSAQNVLNKQDGLPTAPCTTSLKLEIREPRSLSLASSFHPLIGKLVQKRPNLASYTVIVIVEPEVNFCRLVMAAWLPKTSPKRVAKSVELDLPPIGACHVLPGKMRTQDRSPLRDGAGDPQRAFF